MRVYGASWTPKETYWLRALNLRLHLRRAGNFLLDVTARLLDSFGDGGLAGVVSIDSTEVTGWAADSYTDRAEVCFNVGPDCAGDLHGAALEDECGVCDEDPTNDCVQDCEGNWGGTAEGCGNVTLWLTCDDQLEEVRWAVAGVDGYLDQGAPTDGYTSLGWDLPAGPTSS